MSTTFHAGAHNNEYTPDVILVSSDSVFFYLHTHVLLGASENGFRLLLPVPEEDRPEHITVPQTSEVFNIILHAVYDISCAHFSPSFETVVTAVHSLPTYGITVKDRIAPSTQLFRLLLLYAPPFPLELYTLASSYDLYDLAVPTSSYLLSLHLASLTDDVAEQIGPIYLKRLFLLHIGRSEALKHILLPPPFPHPSTLLCDIVDQSRLTRAWTLASAYLMWNVKPGMCLSP